MDNERIITCIICPRSCEISCSWAVGEDGTKTPVVSGFGCVRGKRYALAEMTDPVRTLTTTVRLPSGAMLPVKTSKPVPKARLFEIMNAVNSASGLRDVYAEGETVIENICGTGADLIAARKTD